MTSQIYNEIVDDDGTTRIYQFLDRTLYKRLRVVAKLGLLVKDNVPSYLNSVVAVEIEDGVDAAGGQRWVPAPDPAAMRAIATVALFSDLFRDYGKKAEAGVDFRSDVANT